MNRDRTMKFEKKGLLSTIRLNRADHRKILTEALKGYKNKAIKVLQEHLNNVKKGLRIPSMIEISKPSDHTKEYDRIIAMLERTNQEEVELTDREFGQFVMDDWDWKHEFLITNAIYSASAKKMSEEIG